MRKRRKPCPGFCLFLQKAERKGRGIHAHHHAQTKSQSDQNVRRRHFVEIKLIGDTFDDCAVAAKKFTAENQLTFHSAL